MGIYIVEMLLPAFAFLGESRWTLKVAEKGLIFFFHVVCIDAQFSGIDRGGILFEISCVGGMIDLRNYRSFFSTIIEIVPIDIVEERMGFDSRRSTRDMSETLGWVRFAQLSNDVSSGRWHVVWESKTACDNLLVNAHGILIPKGWLANEELVNQDPKRPPIHRKTMAAIVDDLRSKILGRSTECVGFMIANLLGKPEVNQFDVSFSIKQDILRFKVAISYSLNIMEVFDSQSDFCSIELRGVFIKTPPTS
jgi:hypothetical protein